MKIRWLGPDGMDIKDDKSQRVHAESHGPHGHRLIVMEASEADNGIYKCTLGSTDDKNPRQTIDFSLKVYKSTSFGSTERHSVQPVGSSGQLVCRIDADVGATSIVASWLRDGKQIETLTDANSYRTNGYEPSKQASVLEISPLMRSHDANYTCRVTTDTAQLTKISDFTITLETNYAPIFDSDSHAVWIERHSPLQGSQAKHAYNQYSNRFPHSNSKVTKNGKQVSQVLPGTTNNSVRVELRCTAQANPLAKILWSSTSSSNMVLERGQPEHVLNETSFNEGQNVTSILTINYSLEPNWQYKRDQYSCLASNKIGSATKHFTIEQGDLPPAFSIAQQTVRYNKETQTLDLTILGPNFDPGSDMLNAFEASPKSRESYERNAARLVPNVDSFRVRTEEQLLEDGRQFNAHPSSLNSNNKEAANLSNSRYRISSRLDSPSNNNNNLNNELDLNSEATQFDKSSLAKDAKFPLNFTIKLTKVQAGEQKLFLEAHNAVGWSPNATFLGDFAIVSNSSFTSNSSVSLLFLFALQATFIIVLAINHKLYNKQQLS